MSHELRIHESRTAITCPAGDTYMHVRVYKRESVRARESVQESA